MKKMIIGLLATGTIWGSAYEEYVPCAKTYVDPNVVDLREKKIKVREGEEIYQTSALYSDKNGLFYKDYLDRYEDEESSEELISSYESIDSKLLDKQIDPLKTLTPPEQAPLYTDRLITQSETDSSPPPPAGEKPLHKRAAWPYTNKRR